MAEREEKKLDSSLGLIVKSSLIVFIGVVLSKILSYSYRIILARYYGPEVYGLFSLGIMILGWFIAVSSLGLSEGLLRNISLYRGKKEYDKANYIIKISSIITLFSGIIAAIILFFSAEFISKTIFHTESLILFLEIFSISLPFALFSKIYLSILRAFEKINIYSFLVNIFQNAVVLFLILFFMFLGLKNYNSIALSYSLGFLAITIFAYILCKQKLSIVFVKLNLTKKSKKQAASELLSYSWPLMFLGVIMSLFYWTDSFVIGFFKGVEAVGFYNAAIPLVALLGVFPDIFMQLFFPLITKNYSKKKFYLINQLSKQVNKWIFILNLPIFLLIFIFPGAVINLFFGKEYLVAENVLRILSVGAFFSSLFTLSTNLISMAGKSKLILINISIITIINLILNLILVPRYGIDGAAFSTLVVWILFSIILLLEVRHYTKIIPIRRKLLRVIIVSLIPTLLLIYIKQFFSINIFTLIILSTSFFLLYLLLIFLTGCLDGKDIMIIKLIIGKITKPKSILTNK